MTSFIHSYLSSSPRGTLVHPHPRHPHPRQGRIFGLLEGAIFRRGWGGWECPQATSQSQILKRRGNSKKGMGEGRREKWKGEHWQKCA